MKLIQLLKSLLIGGEPVKAGESVEVSESVARELVGRGAAVPVIAKPEPLEGVQLTKADLTPRHPVFDQEKPAEEPKPRKK